MILAVVFDRGGHAHIGAGPLKRFDIFLRVVDGRLECAFLQIAEVVVDVGTLPLLLLTLLESWLQNSFFVLRCSPSLVGILWRTAGRDLRKLEVDFLVAVWSILGSKLSSWLVLIRLDLIQRLHLVPGRRHDLPLPWRLLGVVLLLLRNLPISPTIFGLQFVLHLFLLVFKI